MKKLLTTLLLTVTFLSYSQNDSTNKNLYLGVSKQKMDYILCQMVVHPARSPIYYTPTIVDLNINVTKKDKFNPEDRKKAFAVLFLAGLAFTTAAILENDYNYGTYQSSPNKTSNYNTTYVTKPFWQQTPRQIMLCVGIGFTLVGGVGVAHK
jgi:hypothetical protein